MLCFVAFATSCKKERFNNNNTGKELLDDELLGLSLIDTSTLAIKIVKSDSLRTDEVSSTVLLGSYVDPVFGKSNAELFTQIKTGGKVDFTFNGVPSSATVDSFYLQLPLVNYYGTLDAQTFEVYRLSEDIVKDNDYYSSQTLNNTSINYVKAGFEIIAPNPTDSVTIGGEKKSPMIRIKLDESLANDIINAGSTALSGDDAFVSWFKGLHIKVNNSTQASGEGAIVGIDIHSTEAKLVLNYTDASDTNVPKKQFDFKLGSNIAYFNHFTHDYTGTSVEALLNNPSLGDNEFYIQSMAGVNTEIDFPHLKNLAGVKNIVINKAILELPINNSSSTNYANPSSTFIFGFSNDGETVFLPDQFLGSIGGTLGTDATYKFNITSFVNKIISGEWTTSKLRVGPVGGSVTANRAVLYGVSSSSAKPVLKLYYSTY
ncbi:MAG: DUF4270 domain-containing protein [Bacteroidia bacterium]